jgi:hypothetical protein
MWSHSCTSSFGLDHNFVFFSLLNLLKSPYIPFFIFSPSVHSYSQFYCTGTSILKIPFVSFLFSYIITQPIDGGNEGQRMEEKVLNKPSSSQIVYDNPYVKRTPVRTRLSIKKTGDAVLLSPSPIINIHKLPSVVVTPPLQCTNHDIEIKNQRTRRRKLQNDVVLARKKPKTRGSHDETFSDVEENSSNVTPQDDIQPVNKKNATQCLLESDAEQYSLKNRSKRTTSFEKQENTSVSITTDTERMRKNSVNMNDRYCEAIRGEKRFRLYLNEPPAEEIGTLKSQKGIQFSWIPNYFIALNYDLGRAYYGGFILNGRRFHTGDKVRLLSEKKTVVIISCYQATKSYHYKENKKLYPQQARGKTTANID